jgi:hypothetical protein
MAGPRPPGRPSRNPTDREPGRGLRAATAGLGLWRRLVRAEPVLVGGAAVVALLAAILLAGGARLLHRVSGEDLRQATSGGQPEQRSVRLEIEDRIGPGPSDDPLDVVQGRGRRFVEEEVPPELARVLGPSQLVIDSPPFRVGSFPDQDDGPFTLSFSFRHQQGIEDHLTLVEGSLPTDRDPVTLLLGPDCPDDPLAVAGFEFRPDRDCRAVDVPVHQVAVTARTADDLLVGVGQRVFLRPDLADSHWDFVFGDLLRERLVLEISGIVELTDPEDPFWYGDPSLHRARITETADFRIVDGAGIIAPDRYRDLFRDIAGVHFDYTWRYPVEPDGIGPDEARTLLAELDKLSTPDGRIVTLLPDVLRGHLAQRALTVALLSTAFAGVVVVAGAAVWVLTSLAVRRQEHTWRLVLERGIARNRLAAIGLVHGLAVAGPAVLGGLAAAWLLVPDSPLGPDVTALGVLGLGVVGASVGAIATAVASRAGPGGRVVVDDGGGIGSARRAVRDGLLVTLAAGAAILVARRSGGTTLDAAGDLDLLLTLAPAVLGAGVAVLTLRLAGPLFRGLAAAGGRARGIVAFLGLRRLDATGRAARSSMVVVLLTTGLAGFSSAVRASVAEGQQAQAWQLVGADVEVRSTAAPGTALAPAVVEGAARLGTVAAQGAEFPAAPRGPVDGDDGRPTDRAPVDVVAIEGEPLGRLLGSAPVEASVRPALAVLATGPAPGRDGVLVAVGAGTWPGGTPEVGDRWRVRLDGRPVDVVVGAVVDRFPGLDPQRPTLLVDLDRLREVRPAPLAPTVIWIGGAAGYPTGDDGSTGDSESADDDGSTGDVAGEASSEVPDGLEGATIRWRADVLAAATGGPLTSWVTRGLRVLTWFAIVVALVAAVAGLGITGPARRRDLGLLTTLGVRDRQATAITAIEQLAPVAVAAGAGAGLAVCLVLLVGPALDPAAFVGGTGPTGSGPVVVPVSVRVDWPGLAGLVVVVPAIVAGATAVVVAFDRRRAPATIVDDGEDR